MTTSCGEHTFFFRVFDIFVLCRRVDFLPAVFAFTCISRALSLSEPFGPLRAAAHAHSTETPPGLARLRLMRTIAWAVLAMILWSRTEAAVSDGGRGEARGVDTQTRLPNENKNTPQECLVVCG